MEIYQKLWKYLATVLFSALLLGIVFVTVRSSEPNGAMDPASNPVITSTVPTATEDSTDGDDDASPNVLEYPTQDGADNHPSPAGNQKATGEFVPLLNAYYNCWKHGDCCEYPFRSYLPVILK